MALTVVLGGGVVLLAALFAYTRFHVHHAQRRHPPKGERVRVGGVDTHVLRRGEGPAPPAVLLHGLNATLDDFDGPILDRLAESREVLALDRPGYGYTDCPTRALADHGRQVDWLDNVLAELGLREVLLVGHSLGGGLAARYALEHPDRVRGLVLAAPYLYPNGAPPTALERVAALPGLRHLVAHVFATPFGRPLASHLAANSFEPEPMPPGYVQLWADFSLRPTQFLAVVDEIATLDPCLAEVAERYPELGVPSVVLAPEKDTVVDANEHAERFHEEVPNTWLHVLEGAGHAVPWTRPKAVIEAVDEVDHLARRAGASNGHAKTGDAP